jgi:hypothetical protein
VVKDIQEFYQLIEKLRQAFPEIHDYESILYYKFHQALNYFPFTTQSNPRRLSGSQSSEYERKDQIVDVQDTK